VKLLVHLHPVQGVMGVWSVKSSGARQSHYHRGVSPEFQERAVEALSSKGTDPTWDEWVMGLPDRHPYFDYYQVVDVPGEPSLPYALAQITRAGTLGEELPASE
jgi:hypothetical protein